MTGSGVVETSHSDSVSTFSRLPEVIKNLLQVPWVVSPSG